MKYYKNTDRFNKCELLVLLDDFNARVDNNLTNNMIYGEYQVNNNGYRLRVLNNLHITNNFSVKKEINKYTWASRALGSLIDYIIVDKKIVSHVQDIHVLGL